MKYLLKNVKRNNLLNTILENRGITDLDLLINPNHSSDTNYMNLSNFGLFLEEIKNNIDKDILILVDSDCDGLTSGAIIYKSINSIKRMGKLDYFLHSKKTHGLTNEFMEFIKEKHYDLIIVPDAGSNDVENIKTLEEEYKMRVIIIDHHIVDKKGEYGILVNNQISENVNKNLTGAGLCYIVAKALNDIYVIDDKIMRDVLNLACIGQIGDSSNLLENEVRNICIEAIRDVENMLLKTFYKDNIYSLTFKQLSFGGIIPLINAVTRVGTLEERILLFEALSDIEPKRFYSVEKRKLNKETRKYEKKIITFNLYEYVLDIAEGCRKLQTKLTNDVLDKLETQYIPENNIQIFTIDSNDSLKGITGLIAMKLSDKYKNPSIVCWLDENNIYRGSLRGNEEVLDSFKDWCIKTKLFNMVQGHANAAGIEITLKNMIKLTNLDLHLSGETGITYMVDDILSDINYSVGKEICNYSVLWDNGVEKPVFAFENITIATSNINWSKNTLRIWYNNMTIIKFKTPRGAYEEIKNKGDRVTLNMVGCFERNNYNGKEYIQVQLLDYEVVENNNLLKKGFDMFF